MKGSIINSGTPTWNIKRVENNSDNPSRSQLAASVEKPGSSRNNSVDPKGYWHSRNAPTNLSKNHYQATQDFYTKKLEPSTPKSLLGSTSPLNKSKSTEEETPIEAIPIIKLSASGEFEMPPDVQKAPTRKAFNANVVEKKNWWGRLWFTFSGIFVLRFCFYTTARKREFQDQFNYSIEILFEKLKNHKLEKIDLNSWLDQLVEIAQEFDEKSLPDFLSDNYISDEVTQIITSSRQARQTLDLLSQHQTDERFVNGSHKQIFNAFKKATDSNREIINQKNTIETKLNEPLRRIVICLANPEFYSQHNKTQFYLDMNACSKHASEIAQSNEYEALIRDHIPEATKWLTRKQLATLFDEMAESNSVVNIRNELDESQQGFIDLLKRVIIADATLKDASDKEKAEQKRLEQEVLEKEYNKMVKEAIPATATNSRSNIQQVYATLSPAESKAGEYMTQPQMIGTPNKSERSAKGNNKQNKQNNTLVQPTRPNASNWGKAGTNNLKHIP